MKISLLLASVAAAGVAAWLINRKMSKNIQVQRTPDRHQKHITNVFSHAKTYANQSD